MNQISNHDLFALAIQGGHAALDLADSALEEALSKHGTEHPVEYPETCYELPAVYAWDGREARTLGQLVPILSSCRSKLAYEPTAANALAAGEVTMIAAEVIEARGRERRSAGREQRGVLPGRQQPVGVVDVLLHGLAA